MKIVWIIGCSSASLLLLWVILKSQMSYDIGRRYLKIVILGVPVRRILLVDIERVGKKELGSVQERWHNSWVANHRQVLVRKRRGWPRELSVTPSQRYVFITELEQAVERAEARAKAASSSSVPGTVLE